MNHIAKHDITTEMLSNVNIYLSFFSVYKTIYQKDSVNTHTNEKAHMIQLKVP